jgi:predicted Zn finger-like uncharacterized protein
MKIVCDACQAKYSIADDKIQGKSFKIRCKKCNHIIVVKTGGDGGAVAPGAEKSKSGPIAAAAVAAQGVWHIVVDGDQVGPLGDAEVKDRLRQGQINPDTLVWKEGFADWVKLSTVPELAAPTARAAQGEPRRSSTRESVRVEASAKAAAPANADEADGDVFGAATVITPAGTADLFASAMAPTAVPTPVAPAPSSPFLFGGSSSQASEPAPVAAKSPGNGAGTSHLTGQRNENSVLFSLSNLEALAVPTQSAGIRAPSTTSTTEGSGLIDIRSMAAMTLNDGGGHDARRSSDSLPTFSTPQFSPVAPVLLPMSSSGPPKWVYPILGLLGVGVLVLGYGIFKVVTAPPPALPPPITIPAPVPPAPAVQPAASGHAAPSVAPPGEGANPSKAEENPSATEEKPAEKGKGGGSSRGEKGHHRGGEQASSKGGSDSRKGAEPSAPSPSHAAETASGAKPTGKKGGKSIDDMLGEVGNKKSGGDDASKPKPAVNLISLTQSDIVNAMRAVQPKIQACANQFKVPGTAMASISVASGGKVASTTVTGKFAGTPTGTCVEAAAKSARFPPCNSMSFPWPFTLSPR